jgi:hypothetical protein
MSMNRKAVFAAGACMATAFLAACSDSSTAPSGTATFVPKSSFAVNTVTSNGIPTAVRGVVIVCKTGNASGSFTFSRTPSGASTGTLATSPSAILDGTCLEVADDNGGSGIGSNVTITEGDAPANTVQTLAACSFIGTNEQTGQPTAPENCLNTFSNGGTIFVNSFHGYVITYNNVFTEPPPPPADVCDFSTFGGFVLLPNNISYGGNAGFASSGFAYGDLNFKNHTNGDHIHVWNVTDYGHPDTGPLSQYPDSRLAFGLASVNGGPTNVPVEWRFVDLGEPAKKVGDAVYLNVGGVVLIPEQVVIGGNIQLHAKCKKAPKAEKH